ncbi:MAG: diphthine synthase [Candidatus Hodarchaeales archaeon]
MPKAETRLFFIGMGLLGLKSCSLESLGILQNVDVIFLEKYTNYILEEIPQLLKPILSKIVMINREDMEDNDNSFLDGIKGKSAAILIPGDPFIATTHNSLRMLAVEKGYRYQTIHNTSIVSAAASASGLSSYRFGKTVTFPFPNNPSNVPYEVIKHNKGINAHTLVLLDINPPSGAFLSVDEAIILLLKFEEKNLAKIFSENVFVVGLARIGYKNELISAGFPSEVKTLSWQRIGPPQALIVCADSLHFAEEEALKVLWGVESSKS